jgi:hypothetical protein
MRLMLLGKGALLAHRAARPLAAESDDEQEHGSRLLLHHDTGELRRAARPLGPTSASGENTTGSPRSGPRDERRIPRVPAVVFGRRALRRYGEIVRSLVDAYGNVWGTPSWVLHGFPASGSACSSGAVPSGSRTVPAAHRAHRGPRLGDRDDRGADGRARDACVTEPAHSLVRLRAAATCVWSGPGVPSR